ncbi:hypothetical protein DL771_002486 [Monosporascus sp. 5C6A]|nr:hypothetical protein DL771_002486 [Monosporascus sp. 5C6A]
MVRGLLDDVSDWLNHRTWIEWRVRDGHGDLRPLRDDSDPKDDKTEEAKWKGYGGRGFTNPPSYPQTPGYPPPLRPPGAAGRSAERAERADPVFPSRGRDVDTLHRQLVMSQENYLWFPLLPILQFRTWHTWLLIKTAAVPTASRQNRPQAAPRPALRSDLHWYGTTSLTRSGDWCKSIVLHARWLGEQRSSQQGFIAVSQARNFTRDECKERTYYIPKEREQSEWGLFYVLLIERRDEE